MPNLVRLFAKRDAVSLTATCFVEQAELDAVGVLGKNCEIHAFSVPGRS